MNKNFSNARENQLPLIENTCLFDLHKTQYLNYEEDFI